MTNIKNIETNKYDPNIFFDKIFIINLDKSYDRWNKITNNLNNIGITNIERQPGYYIPRNVKKINQKLYNNLEAYGGKYLKDKNYILNVIGTNIAHYHIVKKAMLRGYDKILILEDDSYLLNNFKSNFKNAIENLDNWDLIYLGFKKSNPIIPAHRINTHIIKPLNKIRGAYGYALNKSIFPFILNNYLYNGMEIDVFFEYIVIKYCKVYAFYPQIIGHRDKLKSTITNKNWINR